MSSEVFTFCNGKSCSLLHTNVGTLAAPAAGTTTDVPQKTTTTETMNHLNLTPRTVPLVFE